MSIGLEAKQTYLDGFSCGEAVVKVVKDKGLLDNVTSEVIKASSAFKTGIGASKGDLCGCLLAGLVIAGIKYGRDNNKDDITEVNKKSGQLYDIFKEKYGTLRCDELTKKFRTEDPNVWDSQERKEFCSEIVKFVMEQLEEQIL